MSEQEYLEDNVATVAFHLGEPGARLSVSTDRGGLVVDPGEVLKEVSRRIESHGVLVKALQHCLIEHGGFTIKGDAEREARAALALAGVGDLVGGSK